MKKLVIFILISFISFSVFAQLFSDDDVSQILSDDSVVTLYAGQTKMVPVKDVKRIAIAKPEVVDVLTVSKNEMMMLAKEGGETTFVWWDSLGEHSLYIKVYAQDMSKIKERIDRIIAETGILGIETKALDSEGKVVLKGEVKAQEDKDVLFAALGEELKEQVTDLIDIREEETSV